MGSIFLAFQQTFSLGGVSLNGGFGAVSARPPMVTCRLLSLYHPNPIDPVEVDSTGVIVLNMGLSGVFL